MTKHTAELRRIWPERFQDELRGEVFVIASEDVAGGIDLIGRSNCQRIGEDFDWTVEVGWNYGLSIAVYVEDIDEDVATEVEAIVRGLENYPLYDDSDYSERVSQELNEYIGFDLAGDLYHELGSDEHKVWENIQEWIHDPANADVMYEHDTGDITLPFDLEALAAALPESVTKV